MTNETVSIEKFIARLQKNIEAKKADMEKWTQDFLKTPEYCLRWADSLTETVNEYDVLAQIKYLCETYEKNNQATRISRTEIKEWTKNMLDHAIENATGHSTSQMSNVMASARLKVLSRTSGWYSGGWASAFEECVWQEEKEAAAYVLRRTITTIVIKRKKEVKEHVHSYLTAKGWWSSEAADGNPFSYEQKETHVMPVGNASTTYDFVQMPKPKVEEAALLS